MDSDPIATQLRRDYAYAKQLAKVEYLVRDELGMHDEKNVDSNEIYRQILEDNPDISWATAWDQAQQRAAMLQSEKGRKCKRHRNN